MKSFRSLGAYFQKRTLRRVCGLLVIFGLLAAKAGCTRAFYRNSADREVNDILAEKDKYPFWKIEQYHVYPDQRARFADPTNPDRPQMPPDDEATWKMSPHPQQPGHAGVGTVQGTAYLEMVKVWDDQNRVEHQTADKPNPGTLAEPKHPVKAYFDQPLNAAQKGFLLKLDQCIELGVINSREYQNFREQLYEAALPVTLQRFSFSYQWAAVADFIRQWAGPNSSAGLQNNWTGSSSIGFSKLFSTGALLTADFANTTVFNFTGAHPLSSVSTVNLDFAQPLLQGGGKAVTLEPLTQAERDLFYSIRAYARFRKQFNVSIALGASLPSNLATAAGSASGTNPISVLAALGIASTDVSGGFVGYLSTLYRECDLAADQKLAFDLRRALRILEGYQEGGMFSPLQVDQVRSTLLNAENTVLSDQQFVTNAVDQFKLLLGLPANIPLILDDTPARSITLQLDRYYEVLADADIGYKFIDKQEQLPAEKLREVLVQAFTKQPLVLGTQFQKKVPGSWEKWRQLKPADLKKRLKDLSEERRKLFDFKTDLGLKGQNLEEGDERRLLETEFEMDLGGLEEQMRRYENRPWELLINKEQARVERTRLFRQVAFQAQFVMVWARNERFDTVSTLWPAIPKALLGEELDLGSAEVNLAQEAAVQAALTQRVDLMNARAQLVDSWRQLRVAANALWGVATVSYHLDSRTPAATSKALAFSGPATNQQLGFNFQLPLNRLAERNAYRATLINYQLARRNLMALEDNIAVQVRFDVRQLQLFAANYRNQQKTLKSFYSQVENALELIVAPADPDQLKTSGTAGAANAAALTNQYLNALNGLNNAQVKMYDIWLSLLATRMQLYLDLEMMPLDGRGIWSDELDTLSLGSGNAVGNPVSAAPEGIPAVVQPGIMLPPVGAGIRPAPEPLPLPLQVNNAPAPELPIIRVPTR